MQITPLGLYKNLSSFFLLLSPTPPPPPPSTRLERVKIPMQRGEEGEGVSV